MAWRDSRRNRARLLLFISSIIIGIAALVAINSFSENLQKDINSEAKTLLGADLQLETRQPINDSIQNIIQDISTDKASAVSFVSMAYFPKSGNTRLSQIVALEGKFPQYGKMATEPADRDTTFQQGQRALVDKTLMLQFDAKAGEKVKVGELSFDIAAQLNAAPGQSGIASFVAPVIYIPQSYLEQTKLIQKGSRIEYKYYYKIPPTVDLPKILEELEPMMERHQVRYETVASRKRNIGEAFASMASFLNLVGFIALLLGCIGVASAVHIYIKDKLATVAILRTLGTSGQQAFIIYLLQIASMGLIGSIIGAVLGSLLQVALPLVLSDFLPVQNVSNDVSWTSIIQGIFTGLGIAILFALLPLLKIRKTSPLRTLRASYDDPNNERDPLRWLVYLLIFIFVCAFTYVQTGGGWESFIFPVAIGIAFLFLAGVAKLIMILVKKFFPTGWSFVWRQSIANLYRPNNQTLTLIVSIGLGTALISTLFFVQDLLLNQVAMTDSNNQPNMILFDIQSQQKDKVADLALAHGLPLVQQVPVVTMRLDNINGITKAEFQKDSTSEVSRWVYNREYRVTYRDTLANTETIMEGEWHGDKADDGTVYVSMADRIIDNFQAKIGDKLTFNVQGTLIETEVSSFRQIDWKRLQTNFFIVFPTGLLEEAPQFHVLVSRTESVEESAKFQQELVQNFPNVSVVDLTQILKSVDNILTKVSFVIRFMALFSILTGLLVLISSVVLSKYQRIQESVLLRTLGGNRKQILSINAMEYFLLGSIASLTGIILAIGGSWLLAVFSFKVPFSINFWPPFLVFFSITALTVFIGLFNSRDVLNKSPLEVLRAEAG